MNKSRNQKGHAPMTLQQLARKLRTVADGLDELLGVDRPTVNEIPEVAQLIRQSLTTRPPTPKKKTPYKYKKGTHWTQKPENRKRLQRLVKRAVKSRYASPAKGKKYNGTHWTQTPAGRKRMAEVQRAAYARRRAAQAAMLAEQRAAS
jgi:hypothetical protein